MPPRYHNRNQYRIIRPHSNNDEYEYDNDEIETKANNNSRGNVLHARVAPFDYGNFYKLNMNWTEAYLKPWR